MALTKVTGQVIKNTTDVTVGVLTVTNTLAVGGTVSIGGTLTYEDVTNIDSVGLITARNGIVVGSGITLSKDGDGFFTGVTTATTFVGALTGNVTGNVTGNISGGTVAGSTGTFSSDVSVGGELQIADYIVHTGDGNTALRFPAADTITAETNGSERLRIDSNGFLIAKADIRLRRTASDSGALYFGDTNNNYIFGSDADDVITFATANTERLRITANGSVGIATQSVTSARLDVIDGIINVQANDTTKDSRIQFTRKDSGIFGWIGIPNWNSNALYIYGPKDSSPYNETAAYYESATWKFYTGGTERINIDSSGRLLLGTTSGTSHAVSSSNNPLLQVESTSSADYARASFVFNGDSAVGPGLWFAKSRGASIGSNDIINDGDQIGGLFFHAADGTDKHSRCAAIEVKIDGAPGANDTPGLIRFLTTPDGSAAAEEKVRIPGSTWGLLVTNQSSTGSTGGYQTEGVSLRYQGDSTFVKTDAAAVTMTRKGNAGKVLDFYSGTSYAGGVYVNGANSAQYQSSSDYRLKDNVNTMSDGITKIKQLNPIYYTNKQIGDVTDTTTVYTGFLAHEVESVIPTLVDGEKDAPIDEKGKGYQTLNYAGLTPTAIAAIKELIAKVETLETEVAALKSS